MNLVIDQVRQHRVSRRIAVWMVQILAFAVSGILAFVLRFDFSLPPVSVRHLGYALVTWVTVKSIVFHWTGLSRGWWRYVSFGDLLGLLAGNAIAAALSLLVILSVAPAGFPRSIFLLDVMISFLATTGLRVMARWMATQRLAAGGEKHRTLIYGAGAAGVLLLREIENNPKLPYEVAGYLDDDPEKKGVRLLGVPVIGAGEDVAVLVKKFEITTILIAIPSASGGQLTRILDRCHKAQVECKTMPGLDEIIHSHRRVSDLREVAVEDLLGRHPVRIEEDRIRGVIENRMILVTGAAGSIGSELCRQIARFSPAGIIGFDIAESPLFEIEREMRSEFPNLLFYPEVGSIQSRFRLDEVMRQYQPGAVYHAAAYKHVPMMESCVFEALENNVFGTYNLALSAAQHGVKDFVLISSDKAVRPTNVMGATKRMAELILLALGDGETQFVAVRFGNVLGSNGSVIPIFKRQIARGGPVTVTHPEMRRYFMTIPEASQLVLQASAMGQRGQIYVLDMGEPVKIVDLARNLILLSGLRPDADIQITFSGARPGEKLYEELITVLDGTAPTSHEKIHTYTCPDVGQGELTTWMRDLKEICGRRDLGRLVVLMKEVVPDYSPSTHLLKRLVNGNGSMVAEAARREG